MERQQSPSNPARHARARESPARSSELFLASDVLQLGKLDLHAAPILAVLSEAGLLQDDRVPAIVDWFDRQISELPPAMNDELRVWFEVLHHGSTTAPRSRPRSPITIRLRLNWAMPTCAPGQQPGTRRCVRSPATTS
jgi:hypothetical protein